MRKTRLMAGQLLGTSLLILSLGAALACSSPAESADTMSDSAGASGFAGSAGTSGTGAVSGGAGAEASSAGAGGATQSEPEPEPACLPEDGPDDPDDSFSDSNCDGLDGDRSRAVFVSPLGSDDAEGSPTAPLKTLNKAIELAGKNKKDVYVCVGEYAENVRITFSAVSLYGGFDCADWSRSNARPTVKPAQGRALEISSVKEPVTIDRLEFISPDGVAPGESSVAILLADTEDALFTHLNVSAGLGAQGKAGDPVPKHTSAARKGDDGEDAGTQCNIINGKLTPSACATTAWPSYGPSNSCVTGGLVRGGRGGAGGLKVSGGSITLPEQGSTGYPGNLASGTSGKVGPNGVEGTRPASGFGAVSPIGYEPTNNGGDGTHGKPGDSGAGGDGGYACTYYDSTLAACKSDKWHSGAMFRGAGGGQGGYGGCGGYGGKGSGGGGASIALLSLNSRLKISWSTLSTANGGSGGIPSAGSEGQAGGAGGKGGKHSPENHRAATQVEGTGRKGGDGMKGGNGGHGAPGGGGPSIPVIATIYAPLMTAVSLSPGAGGPGGPGLTGSQGPAGESMELKLINIKQDAIGAGGGTGGG